MQGNFEAAPRGNSHSRATAIKHHQGAGGAPHTLTTLPAWSTMVWLARLWLTRL